MTIEYEGDTVDVEILEHDSWDDLQPYKLKFPEAHPMYEADGVWIQAKEYVVISA